RAWLFVILRRRWAKTIRFEQRRLLLETFAASRAAEAGDERGFERVEVA
ncbi:MAG: hypothetical protein COW42_07530, partial [Deltaproteobacteria bacterium CG17_big_fil_post_rev_8_21_14_2_50_63_7]